MRRSSTQAKVCCRSCSARIGAAPSLRGDSIQMVAVAVYCGLMKRVAKTASPVPRIVTPRMSHR